MRHWKLLFCIVASSLGAGCQGVVGTWTADDSSPGPSPIARVSFCPDGTFTAASMGRYGGGQTRVMSGHYTVDEGTIKLETEGQTREYEIKVAENKLIFSHQGKEARMVRMKPRL